MSVSSRPTDRYPPYTNCTTHPAYIRLSSRHQNKYVLNRMIMT